MVQVEGGFLPSRSDLGEIDVDTFFIGETEVTWGEWRAVRPLGERQWIRYRWRGRGLRRRSSGALGLLA